MKFTTFGIMIEVPVKSVFPKPMILLTVDDFEDALIVNEDALPIVSFVVMELYVKVYPTGMIPNNIVIKVLTL